MASELLIVVFAVRHGTATYLKTPNGKHIMIDLGAGSLKDCRASFCPLLRLKNRWKVRRLDLVVVTHPHRHHMDDIFNLMRLTPRVLVRPKHLTEEDVRSGNRNDPGENSKIDKYLEINALYRVPTKPSERIQAAANNGGITLQHFSPKRCATANLNNHSIVSVVGYAGSRIIIPGDNEKASWAELLENDRFVSAIQGTNILLAAHHGQKSGFYPELFQHIKPSLVIASDGAIIDKTITDRYRHVTTDEGCAVRSRTTGQSKIRWVLTTRTDGHIVIRCGVRTAMKQYMNISIG
jgi:competence protein ComEC